MTPARARAFGSVAVAMAVVFAAANVVSPLWPIYRAELHLSTLALTVVFAAYALGAMAALLFLGRLSDVIGRRPILLASVAGTIGASLLFAFAENIGWLLVARFVQGLAVGGVSASANAALQDFSDSGASRRASVVGSIATSLGFGLGPLLAGILADAAPRPTQMIFFVLVAFALIALAATLRLPNSGQRPGARYEVSGAGVPRGIRAPFARATVTFTIGWVGGALFLALGPSMVLELLHTASHTVAGLTLLLFFAAASGGQVLMRRTPSIDTLRAGAVAMGSGLLVAALAALLHSLPLFFVAIAITGTAQGMALLGGLALVNTIAPPDQRASVLSAFFLAGYGGVTVLMPIVGWIADVIGLYHALVAFALFIGACSVGAAIDLTRWKSRSDVAALGSGLPAGWTAVCDEAGNANLERP